jgi:hypothetical protein
LCELVTQLSQKAEAGPGIELPRVDGAAAEDKIERWVEAVRGVWPELLKEDGSLKWGAKADIAEIIFEKRSTAGYYGEVVDKVIERLNSNGRATYAWTATRTRRRVVYDRRAGDVLSSWLQGMGKTTTTPMTTLRRIFSQLVNRVRVVVVVFDWSQNRFYGMTFPRLWGASRLVIVHKADGVWTVERVR